MEYSAAKLFGAVLHFKQGNLRAPFIGGYADTFYGLPIHSTIAHMHTNKTLASVFKHIYVHPCMQEGLRDMGNNINNWT